MKTAKAIGIGLLVSFLCYTFNFSFLPEVLSTKNIVTIIGFVFYISQSLKLGTFKFDIDIVMTGVIAALFSFFCLFSAVANSTTDYTYAKYIVSCMLWVFGAHGICSLIRINHKKIDIELVCQYFIAVAVCQCILSQLILHSLDVRYFIDGITAGGNQSLKDMDRLYGLGASLDTAGTRFSVALLLITYLLIDGSEQYRTGRLMICYYLAFFIILVLGCMISRTTTVGALMSIGYILLKRIVNLGGSLKLKNFKKIIILALVLAVVIPITVYFYRNDSGTREQIRFAFEGFFNWAETGVWRTDSTDKLNYTMRVWPTDNMGWIIGYGLFDNWAFGTDIGYCRFILYCGIAGFSIFVYYFIFLSQRLAKRNKGTGMLAFTLLLLALTIWLKVSTDLFFIYIILISVNFVNNQYVDLDNRRI